jgi:hypothetical protein
MTQGQITENTERCEIIKNVINTYKPNIILEIGTWKGLGSTKCIIDSIGDWVSFLSLETNKSFYDIAVENLKGYQDKVKLIYGRIVEKDEILNFVQTINLNRWEEQWLREDLENVDKSENVLNQIPEKIDLLLLDGGEFSTYPEWLKLRDRSTIIMLDDTTVTKCKKINDELKSSENYTLVFETFEGNGFSVFEKIND